MSKKEKIKAPKVKRAYRKMSAMSLVSMILGLVTVALAAVYLVFRFVSDRSYRRKWQDYEECGMM